MKRSVAIVCASLGLMVVSCGAAAQGGEGDETEARTDDVADKGVDQGEPTELGSEALDHGARPDVGFVAAEGCTGIEGTWRGQVYSDTHGGYYEFTLNVHQAAVGGGTLTGEILARSWQGAPDDVAPPETCEGGFHWTVTEEAAGQLGDDGRLSFGGERSWNVSEHLCGEHVTDYSFDKFDTEVPGATADGLTKLTGLVHDDVVWTAPGLPITLTRVSCEE